MEQLQIMTYVNGMDDKPFLDEENPIYITDFTFTAQRMGSISMTATIMHPKCLDKYWTGKEFVTFRGEKYFVFDTPSSSKNNEDERYKHEITFLSERSILENTYFYDVVTSDTENDKPVSNSTNVVFYGDIAEFTERLNKSLEYSGVGYNVVLDEGISSEPKLISFEDMFFFNVLQEMFSIYEIPFYFVGKTIHIGFTENAITEPFRYGIDYQLLGVNKSNANFRIVTRCTGTGSSDNIPYYYPNNSPKGDIQVVTPFTNQGITAEDIIITDYDKFSREVQLGEEVRYFSPAVKNIRKYTIDSDGGNEQPYSGAKIPVNQIENMMYGETYFRVRFTAQDTGTAAIGFILTEDDVNPNTRVLIADAVAFMGADSTPYSENMTVKNDSVSLYVEKDTEYYLDLTVSVIFERLSGVLDSCNVTLEEKAQAGNIWMIGERQIELSEIGIRIDGTPAIGDFFVQEKTGYINPQQNLMPSIYRQTKGAERFYNAVNDKYPIPDTDPVEYYEFKNQYTELNPREHTQSFDYIKPTIQGMKNAAGQLLGIFKEVAFDAEDNDDVDDEGNYIHPYFFVKLNKFNGTHGFNLFDQASESGAMTISMTTGSCGACQFEIGVGEETQKNIVQVDGSGNLMRDDSGNVIRSGKPQERQNDTVNYEVWLALKKDTSTYGVVMPNATNNYKPKAGDEFVILNINLPQSYILAAEDRLTEAIIKYMSQNNDEKFNFSIDVSRIYIAENKEVADKINENARISLIYNIQDEEPVPEALYISQYTYTQKEGDALPSIQLQLEKEISVHTNSVKSSISAVKQDIMNSIGSIDFLKIGLKYFLRKDVDDYARGKIDFLKGFDIGNFVAGRLGIGGRAEVTEDGSSKLTIDFLEVRRKAIFNEITIQELKHIGGQIILSPAAMVCSDVEEKPDRYRCFFNREDKDGSVIFNEFVVGDQAIKQTFNLEETGYYWRLVIGIGDDYIDLSKKDADSGSDAPQPGDNIVQLGNRTDIERQSAQILSAFGENSPSHIFYKGIDSYTLAEKEIVGTEYDKTENEPRFFCYGSGHIGDKDMAASDSTYVSFSKGEGESKKSLKIKGKVTITGGSSGLDNFDEWKDKQDQIDNATQDAQEAKEAAQNAQQSVTDLEGKFDDIVSDGFVTEAEAIAIQKYINQINESFSAVEATSTVIYKNPNLTGEPKTNLYAAYYALMNSKDDLIATINQVISDGKATTEEVALVDTKFADYNAKTKIFYQRVEEANDAIRKAIEEIANQALNAAGEAKQDAADAIQAANESKKSVSDLENTINGSFKDGIITEAEAKAIEKYVNLVNESFGDLEAAYNEIYANPYLVDESAKNGLQTAFTGLSQKKNALISAINTAIQDGKTTTDEAKAVDTAFEAYNTAVAAFQTAVENANKAIQTYLKGISDAAYEAANQAIQQATEMQQRLDGWAADDVISPAEKESLKNLEKQIRAEYPQISDDAFYWNVMNDASPNYPKWEAYQTAYDNVLEALYIYTAADPENIPIDVEYECIQEYFDAKADLLTAIAEASRERFDDIDKTTEELTAKTKGFTLIDGGLIYSQILNLTEVVGNVSAGASGISKDTEGNPLPAFWAGGTYAEAKGDDTVFVVRHDGSAKFGQVHLDPLGRIVVYAEQVVDWVAAEESVIITSENIPTIEEIEAGNINKTIQNTATSINITATTTNYRRLANSVNVEYEGATITVNTTIKAEYNKFSSTTNPTLKAELVLYLAKEDTPMYELGKVSVDSTDSLSTNVASMLIENVANKVAKGTYYLWMAYTATRENANTLDTLKVSIEASTMQYKYVVNNSQFIVGNGGFMLKASAANYLRATYTSLTAKYASGYVDIPGVLMAGKYWYNTVGKTIEAWGAKAEGVSVVSTTEGQYQIKHNLGHTNYYVQLTPESTGFVYLGAKNTASFYVYTKDKEGVAKGMSFQFAVFGDNK